ncbi:MAG: rhomboid family intramembrane serine protease [Gemmataceae bacterium]
MSELQATPHDTLLKLIAAAGPRPWYPADFARDMGVDRDRIDGPLDELRLAGLIELTPWISGRGQGYELTPHGESVLQSGRLMAQLRAGRVPKREEPVEEIDPALLGTTFGRGEQIRQSLVRETKPRVTQVIIGLNFLVFAAGVIIMLMGNGPFGILLGFGDPRAPILTGAVTSDALLRGEWWRLLTCCFVHHGLIHLGLNMYSLWVVGRLTEQIWGRWRYLTIYLLSGFGGSCIAMYLQPQGVLAGASGALWGIMTSLPVWLMLNRSHLPSALFREWMGQLTTVFILNLLLSFGISGISWQAHLGGGAVGAIAAALLNYQRFSTGALRWAALLLVALLPVLCLGLVIRAKKPGGQMQQAARKNEVREFNQTLAPDIAKSRDQALAAIRLADELRTQRLPPNGKELQECRAKLREALEVVRSAHKKIDAAPPFESRQIRNLLRVAKDAFDRQLEVLELFEQHVEEHGEWQDKDEFEKLKKGYAAMDDAWDTYAELLDKPAKDDQN